MRSLLLSSSKTLELRTLINFTRISLADDVSALFISTLGDHGLHLVKKALIGGMWELTAEIISKSNNLGNGKV
jgi:hypothetical protein